MCLYNSIKNIDADFYSLQRDTGLHELLKFPEIVNLVNKMETFKDTLSIINNLDIIITSCTSIAHAAAALGKRTFILVPISAYYIYCNSYEFETPWYGSNVTVLRQIKNKSWLEPIEILTKMINDYAKTNSIRN